MLGSLLLSDFVDALRFEDSGYKIHKNNPYHKPKAIMDCGVLLKQLAELSDGEKKKDLNVVSI